MIDKKSTLKKLIALGVLLIVTAVLFLLKLNSSVCEFFARTFSRAWIFIFGNLFGVLPFSAYELFLVAVIVGAVFLFVNLIICLCRKKWKRLLSAVLITAITITVFINVYSMSASFSYNRMPLPKEIYEEFSSEDFTKDDAVKLAEIMVEKVNKLYSETERDNEGNVRYPYSFGEISNLLAQEYKRLDNRYFSPYTPKAKKIINKTIMSEMHIIGVFFAPFGEANINGYETSLYLPQTMAHELAHAKGVMRENEANLIANYLLVLSDNPYLSYGATVECMYSALYLLSMYPNTRTLYNEIKNKINDGVLEELKNYGNFWSQFTLLDDIGEFFNDLYLKLQNQGGTGSYVKPPDTSDTGEVDDDDRPILNIINFSDTQNMLIKLYKENKLR